MIETESILRNLVKNKDWDQVKATLNESDSVHVARLIEEVPKKEEIILFKLLERSLAKEVFQILSRAKQKLIIEGMVESELEISNLINDIEPDARTSFLEALPDKVTKQLIELLSPEERAVTERLLGYPKDSIGRLMTPEYIAVRPEYTVEQTFEHIRKYGKDSETLNVVYVINEEGKLIGDVRIKEVLLAAPAQQIQELMSNKFVALHANDDQEIAVRIFKDYDRVALPVIDEQWTLIGIITVDDIMDIEELESTEDFHKFGSFQSAVVNPLKERIFNLYKNRVLWLLALVFMNVFSGSVLASFENVIESVVALVFFLPLLIDSGGNAGAQSATLMIRSLAIGDVRITDWYKLISKELLVSFLLGLTMSLGVALVASFRAPEIIVVVSLTMVLIVIAGSVIGMLLPFMFTQLKIDPAIASAPLITSIADICGVLIYFSIASWYFGF